MNKESVVAFLSAAGISLSISANALASNNSSSDEVIEFSSNLESSIELVDEDNMDIFKGSNGRCTERNNRCG